MSRKLFPPGYQFLDSDGDPVASGTVNFYANGTTTDKNVYTDNELSTAATNPAPLNSAGRFTQGDLYGSGVYTVALNDSTAAQLWSRDDFPPSLIGADVPSATALAVGIGGRFFDVTGTTAITSINTRGLGDDIIILQFDGILTLTHHATDLILPGGASITTAAGDIAIFYEYATGDWRCFNYSYATGQKITGNLTVTSNVIKSVTNTITAGTTQTQAGATALTADINRVTVVGTNGDGVALPTAILGMEILIINDDSTQTIQVWPKYQASPAQAINDGSDDAADSSQIAAGASRRYVCALANNWYTVNQDG